MTMGTIRRIGEGAGVIAEWDTDDPDSVANARKVYDEVAAEGGIMSRCDDGTDLTGVKLEAFDPDAVEILAISRPVGG